MITNESLKTFRSAKGFSFIEIIATVAVLGIVCGLGIFTTTHLKETATDTKLKNDIATLNRAVMTYQANGGSLADKATGAEVLTALKSKVNAADARRLVGARGPFIDLRLQGVAAEGGTAPRAVWDAARQRFQESDTGDGFAQFILGAVPDEPTEDSRATVQKFASTGGWVWDHADVPAASAAESPSDEPLYSTTPVAYNASTSSSLKSLDSPRIVPNFAIEDGLYAFSGSNTITLKNPNSPENSVQMYYSLNDGPWTLYRDEPLPLEVLWNNTVRAYAVALDSDLYRDSPTASEIFRTVFFDGVSDGYYTNPIGVKGTEAYSILRDGKRSKHFEWGKAAIPLGANTLDFSPAMHFSVVPDQFFEIGKVSYTNSTTHSGTVADSIDVEVEINFSMPKNVTEKLRFRLDLESTLNTKDPQASADYVRINVPASEFQHEFQGKTFYLQLSFGNSDANGFTSVNQFHVLEEASASASLYGKLTTKPF